MSFHLDDSALLRPVGEFLSEQNVLRTFVESEREGRERGREGRERERERGREGRKREREREGGKREGDY